MNPQRSRLISGDYILDIVAVDDPERLYYYMVHRQSSGDIIALGHERSWDAAETTAIWTVKQTLGYDPGFHLSREARVG